jgi:hypothetical protein
VQQRHPRDFETGAGANGWSCSLREVAEVGLGLAETQW